VSAGWASPSSRGLWGGDALQLSPPKLKRNPDLRKVHLLAACVRRGIRVLCSGGAGGKADPTKVRGTRGSAGSRKELSLGDAAKSSLGDAKSSRWVTLLRARWETL
jgi:hypothetical protein